MKIAPTGRLDVPGAAARGSAAAAIVARGDAFALDTQEILAQRARGLDV